MRLCTFYVSEAFTGCLWNSKPFTKPLSPTGLTENFAFVLTHFIFPKNIQTTAYYIMLHSDGLEIYCSWQDVNFHEHRFKRPYCSAINFTTLCVSK